jgi:CheY-like chemotaxis protein
LTAHALVEERERCLRIGCDAHLTKPISRQRLIDALVSVLKPS